MAHKKSREQIHKNMSRVRNSDTALEKLLCGELVRHGVTTFTRNNKTIFGKPDIVFFARKIAIFCDGDFWHGYNWKQSQNEIKSNRDFWIPKIERNMQRDVEVTARLQEQGWTVLRFWGHEIQKELLISQLSFECGYSIASLSERLYCAEESEGKKMAGIFIYTASGDAEGTLGGLVRQGRPDAFPRILRKAITNARTCSNDPVCIMSRGQGRDSLNLAACHACGLLPETCCEERNAFLDRGVIVGTYESPEIGFWNDIN